MDKGAIGFFVGLTLVLMYAYFSTPISHSENLDWEISEGEHDFIEVECHSSECNIQISFSQEDYGNVSVFLVSKSSYLSFQSCSDYSAINNLEISNKASYQFDTEVVNKGNYYLVVDYQSCGTVGTSSSNVSTGQASVSTESRGFFERLFS
jgi:hypothetical protein